LSPARLWATQIVNSWLGAGCAVVSRDDRGLCRDRMREARVGRATRGFLSLQRFPSFSRFLSPLRLLATEVVNRLRASGCCVRKRRRRRYWRRQVGGGEAWRAVTRKSPGWKASPTPISFTAANRSGGAMLLRGRRLLPQMFWAKRLARRARQRRVTTGERRPVARGWSRCQRRAATCADLAGRCGVSAA
jgi:hypothetical protein